MKATDQTKVSLEGPISQNDQADQGWNSAGNSFTDFLETGEHCLFT
jgi:hypothetical protein